MNNAEIIICAYGSRAESAQKSYELMERAVAQAHPGHPVSWAYTGHTVRKLLAQMGKPVDSPAEVLARLDQAGKGRAVLFSLHLLPAAEFEELDRAARGGHGPVGVVVSRPLLDQQADYARLARAIVANLPQERQPGQAVVLAGHGTKHPAGVGYQRLGRELANLDEDIHLAVLEHGPGLESLLSRLEGYKPGPVWLMPLLVTTGIHAGRDVVGEKPESWQSRLERAGFECRPLLLALADLPEARDIWLDHLKQAVQDLTG